MGSRCFPIVLDPTGDIAWFRADEISPELTDDRSGFNPAGTADSVFVVDLVLGTEDRRDVDDAGPPPGVGDDKFEVEPA